MSRPIRVGDALKKITYKIVDESDTAYTKHLVDTGWTHEDGDTIDVFKPLNVSDCLRRMFDTYENECGYKPYAIVIDAREFDSLMNELDSLATVGVRQYGKPRILLDGVEVWRGQ